MDWFAFEAFLQDWYTMDPSSRDTAMLEQYAERFPYNGRAYRSATHPSVSPPASWSKTRQSLQHYLDLSEFSEEDTKKRQLFVANLRGALDLEGMAKYVIDACTKAGRSVEANVYDIFVVKEVVSLSEPKILKTISENAFGGSDPSEGYGKELEDDPALKAHSVYVPDDIKRSISKWSKAMGLSGHRRTRKRRKRHT